MLNPLNILHMKRLLFLTALILSLYSCSTTYGQTESGFYNVYEQYIPDGCIDYGGYAVHYYGNGVVLVGRPAYGGGWIWEEHYVDFSPIHRYIRQHRINVLEIGFIWLDGRLLFNIMGANCHYTYNPYWGWRYYGYNPYSYHCSPWNYSYHGLSWYKPPRHNYARRDAHRNSRVATYHGSNSGRSSVKSSRSSVSRERNTGTTERSKSSTPANQNRRQDVQNSRNSVSREQNAGTKERPSTSSRNQNSRSNSGNSSVRSRSTNEKSSAPAKSTRSSSGRSSDNSRRR